METPRPGASQQGESTGHSSGQQIVYVVPQASAVAGNDDDIDLAAAWHVLWDGKWWILAVAALLASVSIAYALLATEWFRAEVLLAPAEEMQAGGLSTQLGGLSSLAGIAGIRVGAGSNVEPIAVLRSREFAREFIDDRALLTVLLADQWDSDSQRWRESNPDRQPDVRDAVQFFNEKILTVDEESKTGLVRLSIDWTDPEVAATWANDLVDRLNERMRHRALSEAKENIGFLEQELAATSVVALQQSIGRILESEMQKMMLARGREEFTFRVIDPASVPKERIWPRRALISILGGVVGGLLAVFFMLGRYFARNV